jgi:hypothetical protein
LKRAPFKIPRRIRIRGKLWRVKFASELDDADDLASKVDLDGCYYGLTHRDTREIHLSERQTPRETCATFLHEILHACYDGPLSDKREEEFIRNVEKALLGVLEQLKWR